MLRTSQAAAIVGVHPDTLKDWRYRKIGPPYHKTEGGHPRYDEEELRQWLQQRKESA